MIKFNNEFVELIEEVRQHRAKMKICLSAQENVDISAIILEFCNNSFYEEDYKAITSYFTDDFVSYSDVVEQMKELAQNNLFSKKIL